MNDYEIKGLLDDAYERSTRIEQLNQRIQEKDKVIDQLREALGVAVNQLDWFGWKDEKAKAQAALAAGSQAK